jgi:hypothetical protein
MKLVGRILAIGFTGIPYFFVLFGAFFLGVQVQLDPALDILAEFPALVIHISINRHSDTSFFLMI